MGENIIISNAGQVPKLQFCTLEYRPQNWDIASSQIAPVILLVLRDERGNLRFLDLDYIESLLLDFGERAKQHPDDLFKQLSFLNVGPLVTKEVGSSLSDFPAIQKLSSDFVQL
jgi:hypothetical protein